MIGAKITCRNQTYDVNNGHDFLLLNVTGINPPKGTINTTNLAGGDGSILNSARVGNRNIVFTIKLMGEIEKNRQKLYRIFPVGQNVTIYLTTANRKVCIEGTVESNEVSIFTKNEQHTISVICPRPFLKSVTDTLTTFSGIVADFTFPFAIEPEGKEFSRIMQDVMKTVYNDGEVSVGAIIELHAIGTVKNPTIYNTDTNEKFVIDTDKIKAKTGNVIIAKDTITIKTIQGEKEIYLLRDGKNYNIINCVDKNSKWIQLLQGDNILAYTCEEGESNLKVKVIHTVAYEGI